MVGFVEKKSLKDGEADELDDDMRGQKKQICALKTSLVNQQGPKNFSKESRGLISRMKKQKLKTHEIVQ